MHRDLLFITETEKNELITSMYKRGALVGDICMYANTNMSHMYRVLKRKGISLRDGFRVSESRENVVVNMYNEGSRLNDIMHTSGIKSEQTIYRILRSNNVKLRR